MFRHRLSRVVLGALVLAITLGACRYNGFGDAPSTAATTKAVTWLKTQQQADGGFEVAGFPGFETPDAVLAIANGAQNERDVELGPRPQGRARDEEERQERPRCTRQLRRRNRCERDRRRPGREADRARRQAARALVEGLRSPRRRCEEPRRYGQRRAPPQRVLRTLQCHAVRSDCQGRAQRRRVAEDRRVHPGRAAGERRLELHRQPERLRSRRRHHGTRDPGARRGGRRTDGHRPRPGPAVPRLAAPGSRGMAVVRLRRPELDGDRESSRSPRPGSTSTRRAGATPSPRS